MATDRAVITLSLVQLLRNQADTVDIPDKEYVRNIFKGNTEWMNTLIVKYFHSTNKR